MDFQSGQKITVDPYPFHRKSRINVSFVDVLLIEQEETARNAYLALDALTNNTKSGISDLTLEMPPDLTLLHRTNSLPCFPFHVIATWHVFLRCSNAFVSSIGILRPSTSPDR